MSLNAIELNFPPPNDVIRPRPLRPTSLFVTYDIVAFRDVAFDAKIAVGGRFLVRSVYQLIPTVKMETRHPVVAIFPFIGKTTPYAEFSKLCSESFHRDIDRRVVFKFCEIRREIGEIVRYLPDKIFALFSSSRYCADRAQDLPEPTPDNVL